MKYTLDDLPNIELGVSERLELFREGCGEKNKIKLFWEKGWLPVLSMWDYRWEKDRDSDLCESIAFIAKPIKIKKLIKSFKQDHWAAINPNLGELLSDVEIDLSKVTFNLKKHEASGYYSYTTLDLYEERMETDEEFAKRKNLQEAYINKTKKAELKRKQAIVEEEKEKELKELKRLQNKYYEENI